MMVVLAALGTFALTSALVNRTYSRRAIDWSAAYYDADAKAEEFLAKFDGALAEAEKKAIDEEIAAGVAPDSTADGLMAALDDGYGRYLLSGLQALGQEYPGLTIGADGGKITVRVNFQADSNEQCNLAVTLEAEAMNEQYDAGVVDGALTISRKDGAARYKILEWAQWQPDSYDGDNGQQLWNGDTGMTP